MVISTQEMLLRLAVAAALGGLVGLERERVEPAAGLRTHAVVALGAAMFMLVSMFGFANADGPPSVVLDPSRVAAQIVSGIGFLGAGVIIFRKEIIRGLTTAASVWLVAGLGMAVGGGLYLAALGATTLGLAFLAGMKPLERRFAKRRRPQLLTLVIDRRRISATQVQDFLLASGISIERIEVRFGDDPTRSRLDLILKRPPSEHLFDILERLSDQGGVREVRSTVEADSTGKEQVKESPPFASEVLDDTTSKGDAGEVFREDVAKSPSAGNGHRAKVATDRPEKKQRG